MFVTLGEILKNPTKLYPTNLLYSAKYRFHLKSLHKKVEKIKKANFVWHVCTPKSASTYFGNYCCDTLANNLVDHSRISGIPVGGNRPQVICAYSVSHGLKPNAVVNLVNHRHVIATDDFCNMISDNHVVMCQIRGILDTITSLKEHMDKRSINPFVPTACHFWEKLDETKKYEVLARFYLPWHISYIQSWLLASETKNVKWLSYADAVNSPNKCFNDAFSKFNVQSDQEIDVPISKKNFNKGIEGRGRTSIPEKIQKIIFEDVKKLDVLNQDLESYL